MLPVRTKYLVPSLYLAFALYVWIDFTRLPKDGLANLGLMVATLPVAMAGLLLSSGLGETDFVLLPRAFGYYGDHAIYYWPSVGLITVVLYWICARLGRSR